MDYNREALRRLGVDLTIHDLIELRVDAQDNELNLNTTICDYNLNEMSQTQLNLDLEFCDPPDISTDI